MPHYFNEVCSALKLDNLVTFMFNKRWGGCVWNRKFLIYLEMSDNQVALKSILSNCKIQYVFVLFAEWILLNKKYSWLIDLRMKMKYFSAIVSCQWHHNESHKKRHFVEMSCLPAEEVRRIMFPSWHGSRSSTCTYQVSQTVPLFSFCFLYQFLFWIPVSKMALITSAFLINITIRQTSVNS